MYSRSELNKVADAVYEEELGIAPVSEDTQNKIMGVIRQTFPDVECIGHGYGRTALHFSKPPHRPLTEEEQKLTFNGVVIKIAYADADPDTGDDGAEQNGTELYFWRDSSLPIPQTPVFDHQETVGTPNWIMMPYRTPVEEMSDIEEILDNDLSFITEPNDVLHASSWGRTETGDPECIDYGRFSPYDLP